MHNAVTDHTCDLVLLFETYETQEHCPKDLLKLELATML